MSSFHLVMYEPGQIKFSFDILSTGLAPYLLPINRLIFFLIRICMDGLTLIEAVHIWPYFNRGTPRGSPSGHRLSYINRTSTSLAAASAPPPQPARTSSPLWLRPTTPRRPSTTSKDTPSASGQCLEAVPRLK